MYVLSKNKKNIKNFQLKIEFFTASCKSSCILHGRVCVMYQIESNKKIYIIILLFLNEIKDFKIIPQKTYKISNYLMDFLIVVHH